MSESIPLIRTPARYVPLAAIAIGASGGPAVAVSAANPVPCSDQPLSTLRALIPDTAVEPGNALLVDCSSAGKIMLEFSDGSQIALSFAPGVALMPFAIARILSNGTTASFNAWVLA